jgi:hypothetical protein
MKVAVYAFKHGKSLNAAVKEAISNIAVQGVSERLPNISRKVYHRKNFYLHFPSDNAILWYWQM